MKTITLLISLLHLSFLNSSYLLHPGNIPNNYQIEIPKEDLNDHISSWIEDQKGIIELNNFKEKKFNVDPLLAKLKEKTQTDGTNYTRVLSTALLTNFTHLKSDTAQVVNKTLLEKIDFVLEQSKTTFIKEYKRKHYRSDQIRQYKRKSDILIFFNFEEYLLECFTQEYISDKGERFSLSALEEKQLMPKFELYQKSIEQWMEQIKKELSPPKSVQTELLVIDYKNLDVNSFHCNSNVSKIVLRKLVARIKQTIILESKNDLMTYEKAFEIARNSAFEHAGQVKTSNYFFRNKLYELSDNELRYLSSPIFIYYWLLSNSKNNNLYASQIDLKIYYLASKLKLTLLKINEKRIAAKQDWKQKEIDSLFLELDSLLDIKSISDSNILSKILYLDNLKNTFDHLTVDFETFALFINKHFGKTPDQNTQLEIKRILSSSLKNTKEYYQLVDEIEKVHFKLIKWTPKS